MIIFYVHKGCQEYLMASIKQIQSRIPNVDIVLLGDQFNNDISGISRVIMDDYADFAEKFKENYQHFSPNDYDYELFCIQRWFYIYAYMIKNEINHAIYIDSDVLLNCLPENIVLIAAIHPYSLLRHWKKYAIISHIYTQIKKKLNG